jgi:hypothetical protein
VLDRKKNPHPPLRRKKFSHCFTCNDQLHERLSSGYCVHCNLSLGGSIREFLDTYKKIFMGIVAIHFLIHPYVKVHLKTYGNK